jgi:serine/threonine protein phosphatase 1
MKTFVIGDIHGAYKALIQCFQRSGFDRDKDRLIVLGDICDGFAQVDRCIKELLKIKHCYCIVGNHDQWALKWAETGREDNSWLSQGGRGTIESYGGKTMPQAHIDFLKKATYWFESDGKIFMHGGFDFLKPLAAQDNEEFIWNRSLIDQALKANAINPDYQLSEFKEIYVGHTPTVKFDSITPLKLCNVWDMDTAAGWGGKLSIMDVNTKEYWQSDSTSELYPDILPRR